MCNSSDDDFEPYLDDYDDFDSDENYDDIEERGGYDSDDVCQEKLEKLKTLRGEFDGRIEKERHSFFRRFVDLIPNPKCEKQLPNLRDIFRSEEIDCLLMAAAENWKYSYSNYRGQLLIRFVARTGYRDEPRLDADGKPVLSRATALHWAAQRYHDTVVPNLFKIFYRLDVNYIGEFGFTHFHAACASGEHQIVREFLELGQDVNCLPQESNTRSVNPPLLWAVAGGHKKVVELLMEKGANPNLANENGLTSVHALCVKKRENDFAKTFFDIIDETHQTVQVDAMDKSGWTPLLHALVRGHKNTAELLLRRGANPKLANKEGLTPLHLICKSDYDYSVTLLKIFFKVCNEKQQTIHIDPVDKAGRTPLHYALNTGHEDVVEFLLQQGANPNFADENGLTCLHLICKRKYESTTLLEILFEISDEKQQTIQIDPVDKAGRTPLHYAVDTGHKDVVELLLRRGANPNLADEDGLTCLHLICKRNYESTTLLEILFEISDEKQQTIKIDAKDKSDWTSLHYAVDTDLKDVVEFLLRRGANPNLVNELGETPLHIICKYYEDPEYQYIKDSASLLKILFQVSDEKQQTIQVDAIDKSGRTLLEWAVARSLPNVVSLLLCHGADLTKFTFPTESHFEEKRWFHSELMFSSDVLEVVELLEKRGYELDRCDAQTIIKLFTKRGLFKKSDNLNELLLCNSYFVSQVEKCMIKPDLSLYNLIRMGPKEASKSLTIAEFLSFLRSYTWPSSFICYKYECEQYLCEVMTVRFLRRWTLEFFSFLTQHQLPILCCEKILKKLSDEDWLSICLAADIAGTK